MSESKSIGELLRDGEERFESRHLGPDDADVAAMLDFLGHSSLETFLAEAIPARILSQRELSLPAPFDRPMQETEALSRLAQYASENEQLVSMIGMGYSETILPSVILRNVFENPGWYTAYTPYQPEVSQGRLELLLNFQQMVMDLTGMEIANASLLDEATAAAEAMAMCRRVAKKPPSNVFWVDSDCHPQTLDVLKTRAAPLEIELQVGDSLAQMREAQPFAVLLSYPCSSGRIAPLADQIAAAQSVGAMTVVASDLLALVELEPPGGLGADCVVGSAQRFGVPLGFGGPHAAFFATKDTYKRSVPGRMIGVSIDQEGRRALRMALQTREQHIRREKATSNICTAQVLLAVLAALYGVYHGASGLRRIARRVHRLTLILAARLEDAGFELCHREFFDTLAVRVPGRVDELLDAARALGLNLRRINSEEIGISLSETTEVRHLEMLLRAFSIEPTLDLDQSMPQFASGGIPAAYQRRASMLTHPNFSLYRSETEMMRYLRRLQSRDIALDRSMIPLGSCTMKLNAATEMIPVSWPGFARIHPFVPAQQRRGYDRLISDLEKMLCAVTGFDAVSLQPNAGSQGEYAGLLAISRYHVGQGESHRNVCLIPSSAHGTNPASAVMAGMKVVVVACDREGNVDVADLEAKASEHRHALAALMLTYPSTHGVFEEAVKEICEIVHRCGGQVYMDGANLNALVGYSYPAELGADVSHMNLHKTFCIPHGGGGPGVGPIGVKSHLAPYLPGHCVVSARTGDEPSLEAPGTGHAVSAAPWGSASILPISWAYIAMMGAEGLRKATAIAILNANYVAARLQAHFPVVYTGPTGRVAHECIIDLRAIKEETGVGVDDVAKRLIDFGFHAPTMSWPVPETLMIEPTESESKFELDRFCDALIAIRGEIESIRDGSSDKQDNPLKNAPHTAQVLLDNWQRAYSVEQAAFPLPTLRDDKYWPPVGRVNNAHGDRHLVCSCPPLEAYAEAAD